MHGIGGQPDWTSEDPQSGSPPSEGKPPLFILGILVPLVLMVVTQLGQALLALGGGGYILALLLASIQFVSPLFSVGLAGILIWMSLDRATATRTSLGEPFEIQRRAISTANSTSKSTSGVWTGCLTTMFRMHHSQSTPLPASTPVARSTTAT
ncbi:hypothetical protein [Halovenus salina]|uniref:Uncharacterized protein n=1 Tax=Halovenus salina TaxID=1510225 RepID=A0ABD5W3S1_9EURY